jgi:dipeptidyl aminopeptidase/acylaminoacyl peptidase
MDAPAAKRRIRPDGSRYQFVAPGYLLYAPDGILLAQRVDPRELRAQGEAVPLASSLASFNQVRAWGWFSASNTGQVAWLSSGSPNLRLQWIDRSGRDIAALGAPAEYGQVALSPDDKRVVVEVAGPERRFDLWLIDVARGVSSRFTTDPANDRDPVWSPDGLEVVYSSDASGDQNLMRKGLQGSAPVEPLPMGIGQTGDGNRDIAESWTQAGDILIYMTVGPGAGREGGRAFFTVSLKTGGKPEPLMKDDFAGDEPQVSRDGRWLAYRSQDSGNFEVYVEPFRRSGERIRVSTRGGGQPKWRGDGKELFYLQLDGSLMAASVREGKGGLEVGMPVVLVPARDLRAVTTAPDYDDYAVSSDGQRFLIKRADDDAPRQAIHLLLEWPSLVK